MKVSIIGEGGAMRASYVLGAMDALYSHYGLKRTDVVTATSGAAPAMAFYAAGSFPSCYKIWKEEVPSARMAGLTNLLRRRPYMDIDYLVDVIIRKIAKLDADAIRNSPTQLVLPVTSYKTGAIEFINFSSSTLDVFEVLRAAMSVPVVYNKSVRLNGDIYFDSHLGDPLCLDNPYTVGTRKIIILTSPLEYAPRIKRKVEATVFRPLITPVIYRALLASANKRAQEVKKCLDLRNQGDVVIAPAYKKGRAFNNSSKNITLLIEQGYADTVASVPLQKLVGELRASPRADFYFSPTTL